MRWPCVKLGDIMSLEYGKSLPARERNTNGKFQVAGSNGPNGKHSSAFVSGPGIVVGRKGSAGKVYWYDADFWPIDTTYYIVPKLPLDMRWAFYLLSQLNLVRLSTTTGVPGLNRNAAYGLSIPLPSISEQRRIVEILEQADRLRKLRADADAKAQRILPALFIKMFGDPVANRKNWPIEKFGNVGTLERGKSKHRPINDPVLLGGTHPLIQTGDVANSGGRIRSYTQTYSDVGLSQSRMWPSGTLCITIAANIAKTGILEFDACFPDSIVGFHPDPYVTTEYVQSWLWFLQPVLENSAPQAAQKNINLQVLRALPIPIPPKQLQEKFSRQTIQLNQQKSKMRKESRKIELLLKSLQHRAFTGDLTASWCKAHMNELLQEMELQSSYLEKIK